METVTARAPSICPGWMVQVGSVAVLLQSVVLSVVGAISLHQAYERLYQSYYLVWEFM